MLLVCAGCQKDEPSIDPPVQENTDAPSQPAQPDSTDAEVLPPEDVQVHSSVINNGGLALSYENHLYYWKLADNDASATLVADDRSGETKDVYVGAVRGNLYIHNNRLYINSHSADYRSYYIICVDLAAETSEKLENMQVVAIDESLDTLVLASRKTSNPELQDLYLLSSGSNEMQQVSNLPGTFQCCLAQDGILYLYENTGDGSSAKLYALALQSQELTAVTSVSVESDSEYMTPICRIPYMQITDSSIYFSYGFISGSGNYYQPGGGFVRVDKQTYKAEVLTEMTGFAEFYEGPEFYVFLKDNQEYMLFSDYNGVQLMEVATKKITPSDMPLGVYNQPFDVMDEDFTQCTYWIYPSDDGDALQLLPEMQQGYNMLDYIYIENVCSVGDYVFYEEVHHKDNPNPTSWRDYTVVYLRTLYLHNRQTGESTALCQTQYS